MRVIHLFGVANAFFVFLVAITVGCSSGPRTGKVQGKVSFEGNPVTEGLITFLNPKEGGAAEAEINKDGTYAVKVGVVVGDYLVVITPHTVLMDTDPGKSPPAPVEKPAPNIPQRYRQQGSTTLKAKVAEGMNTIDFEMTKAPK